MDSLTVFTSFPFKEGDDIGDIIFVMITDLTKGTAMTFQNLTLLSLNKTQLLVTVDSFATIRRANSGEEAPFLRGIQAEADHLARTSKRASSIKELDLIFIGVIDIDAVSRGSGNETELLGVKPFPEENGLIDFDGLELVLGFKVPDLPGDVS